jgi:hypothetical protein
MNATPGCSADARKIVDDPKADGLRREGAEVPSFEGLVADVMDRLGTSRSRFNEELRAGFRHEAIGGDQNVFSAIAAFNGTLGLKPEACGTRVFLSAPLW